MNILLVYFALRSGLLEVEAWLFEGNQMLQLIMWDLFF